MSKQTNLRQRHILDAEGMAIGRLATKAATLLRGKHKPSFEPHKDEGDFVEVVNLSKAVFTGKKMDQKKYYSYSGYPGGLKTKAMSEVFVKEPGEVLRRAVKQMLPNNRLCNDMIKRLSVK
ncbi:MAG: 50S ribosomal protein L13 [Patescibacteria group bacterium]|nr:MAG: 50S ribosomal protein L13 [Patescibacteria group bacterium]